MILNQNKKLNIGTYLLVLSVIIMLIVVFFIMYKYQVEGEAIPPFKIAKMIVISTAKTDNIELIDSVYSADIIQTNDIKISIEKNQKYKKEAIIKNVILNNIQIDKKETTGNIEIYRPSKGIKLYEYKPEYKVMDSLTYVGAQETYIKGEELAIANQGGIIEFSIILNNLQKIKYNEDETIKVDGTLLKQIESTQLEYNVSFDLIIELENNLKLKTKITLNLPEGDILENGIETLEETQMKTVFKRI